MSPGSYLIIFCSLAVFSLTAVSIVNKREERQRALKQRQRRLRFQMLELEELVLNIHQLVENHQTTRLLNEELLATILAVRASDGDAAHLDALYHTALARHENLSAEEPDGNALDHAVPRLNRLQHSDSDIGRAKRMLNESLVMLRRQQRRGKIEMDELRTLQLDLSWANLMVDVISLIGQGHKSIRRNQIFTAHAFYKKAQQLLIQSAHPDIRRKQFIREITELMQGKRRSLSLHLMPESALNPDTPAEAQLLDLPAETDPARPTFTPEDEAELAITGLEAWQN